MANCRKHAGVRMHLSMHVWVRGRVRWRGHEAVAETGQPAGIEWAYRAASRERREHTSPPAATAAATAKTATLRRTAVAARLGEVRAWIVMRTRLGKRRKWCE